MTIFNQERKPEYTLEFPFRWFFKTLYVKNSSGQKIGHLQQCFAIFRKKFDIHDRTGKKSAYINSSFFRFWTFDVFKVGKIASIQKKWPGAPGEFFTDKDNFVISYVDPEMQEETKTLIIATCLMVDIRPLS